MLQPPSLIHILLEDGRLGHKRVSDVITSHLCVTEKLSHQCFEQRLMWELLNRVCRWLSLDLLCHTGLYYCRQLTSDPVFLGIRSITGSVLLLIMELEHRNWSMQLYVGQ